ncbi:MAG: hypothetical protein PHW82_16435 [Bacteroidales bacterium]|nr:hypothetical protein [Bacteroidales bacterium]
MSNGIYVSINKNSNFKIVSGVKNHEFRNYIPKEKFDLLYVYETSPTSKLKYLVEIGKIVEYPNKLNSCGDGNTEFNEGIKSKYAYEILKVYELIIPITLNELKEKFNFMPPQAFAYGKRYPELTSNLEKSEKKLIIGG